jgi:hypothetical protein
MYGNREHDSIMNRMSGVMSVRTHCWTVKAMGVGALLFCAMGSGLCQAHPQPYTFFKQYIGLKDEIASIELSKAIAIKQLYASHYFETALDVSVCARDSSHPDEKGFYLITMKGSRHAGLTGVRGSMIRSSVVSKIRSSLEASLTHAKRVLESSQ